MIAEIIACAAAAFNVSPGDITGQSRLGHHVRARQAAAYAMRARGKMSLPQIARAVGKSDHSTIIHACRRAEALMERDPSYREAIEGLIALTPASYVPRIKLVALPKPKPKVDAIDQDIAEFTNRRTQQAAGSRMMLAALGLRA